MPLCSECKSEAEVTSRDLSTGGLIHRLLVRLLTPRISRSRDTERCDECDRCNRSE